LAVIPRQRREGRRTLGLAFTGKAAQGLEEGAGVPSMTLYRGLKELGASWVDDMIHHGRQLLRAALKKRTYSLSRLTLDSKTTVVVDEASMASTHQLAELVRHVEKAKARLVLVGDARQLQPGAARIELLPPPVLREKLSSTAIYVRMTENGRERVHIPSWVVSAVQSRGEWPVSSIEMISTVPILRPNGTILDEPGFDHETGVFYMPDADYPELMDYEVGLKLLEEVFCDFPFATPAHRAASIAAVLTPFGRQAIDGCTPLFMVDGNIQGVGKGLLIDAITAPFSTRSVARMSAPSTDDEWRKRITAIAIAGEPIVVIDNVNGVLGGASLDAALTSARWSDRILGVSETVSLPLTTVWLTTGNNLRLTKDTARRTAHIRLHSLLEHPEERTDFVHPNLKEWLAENRPALAIAALSILKAYIDAGKPDQNLTPWGSFESWSNLIRAAVKWLGLPDPGATRIALRDDEDTVLLDQVLAGWQEADPHGTGMTVAQALSLIVNTAKRDDDPYSTLRVVVESLSNREPARELGGILAKFKERVCKGRYFDGSTKNRNKVVVWKVVACKTQTEEGMPAKAAA
jgi:AAA domain